MRGLIPGGDGSAFVFTPAVPPWWLPWSGKFAAMAYGETPSRRGAPAGTLVFDVELIRIGE